MCQTIKVCLKMSLPVGIKIKNETKETADEKNP